MYVCVCISVCLRSLSCTSIEVSYNYLSQGYDSFVTNGSYVNCELNQIMSQ